MFSDFVVIVVYFSFFPLICSTLLSRRSLQKGRRKKIDCYGSTHTKKFSCGDICTNNSCEFYSQLINSFWGWFFSIIYYLWLNVRPRALFFSLLSTLERVEKKWILHFWLKMESCHFLINYHNDIFAQQHDLKPL